MLSTISPCELTDPINISKGKIVGRKIIQSAHRPVNAYQGIPFAKPPVGELRFMKSQECDPWDGILHTTAFRARPVQMERRTELEALISEDCLYLNVFAPAWTNLSKNVFPVMMFIHGGGFVSDSAPKYGDIGISKHLVAECEVVVVTIEYRLGFLGFFSTGDTACDDNAALWDMKLALEWIQENIRTFHGDQNNVTIFGQSAGGAAVDLLSLSPHSNKLFHRVIPMSGCSSCDWAINHDAVERCRKFANRIGVFTATSSEQMIRELRAVDALKFANEFDIKQFKDDAMTCVIAPRIDNNFLPRPLETLRQHAPKFNRLIGFCEFEGLGLVEKGSKIEILQEKIAERIPELEYDNFLEIREKALNLYIKPADYNNEQAIYLALTKFASDTFINIGVQRNVLKQLRLHNNGIYLYSFDYCNPKAFFPDMPLIGATHCMDLNYLLDIRMFSNYEFTDTDKQVMHIVTKLWSNFAKYGDPNGSSMKSESQFMDFKWYPVTVEHPSRYLSIGPKPKMYDYIQDGRPMFWLHLEKQRKSK